MTRINFGSTGNSNIQRTSEPKYACKLSDLDRVERAATNIEGLGNALILIAESSGMDRFSAHLLEMLSDVASTNAETIKATLEEIGKLEDIPRESGTPA